MKARHPHLKEAYTFTWRGKAEFITVIPATSLGKAWKEFRRHHSPHAKKKEYIVTVELRDATD